MRAYLLTAVTVTYSTVQLVTGNYSKSVLTATRILAAEMLLLPVWSAAAAEPDITSL